MHRVSLLPGLSLQALAHRRGFRVLRSRGLLHSTLPQGPTPQGPTPQGPTPQGPAPQGPTPQGPTPQGPAPQGPAPQGPTQPCGRSNAALVQFLHPGYTLPQISFLSKCSDLSTQKFTLIYSLPHIRVLRAISRLKLLQTGVTLVILPPVFCLYLQGSVSYVLLSYSSGIALFAGLMLYAVSHFLRRCVGMMYVDEARTTLKVSHLTFWGRRKDVFLPVSDVVPLGEAGDSEGEPILRLRRYSAPHTLYLSTRFGRVTDKTAFQEVFGTLT